MAVGRWYSAVKPGFHIVVSDGDASQSVDRRCCWDALQYFVKNLGFL